jgi:hypothetical protein
MYEAHRPGRKFRSKHSQKIEGDDIEDLDRAVDTSSRETTTISADTDALNFSLMCPEFLDEFYTICRLFPELDHTVD